GYGAEIDAAAAGAGTVAGSIPRDGGILHQQAAAAEEVDATAFVVGGVAQDGGVAQLEEAAAADIDAAALANGVVGGDVDVIEVDVSADSAGEDGAAPAVEVDDGGVAAGEGEAGNVERAGKGFENSKIRCR